MTRLLFSNHWHSRVGRLTVVALLALSHFASPLSAGKSWVLSPGKLATGNMIDLPVNQSFRFEMQMHSLTSPATGTVFLWADALGFYLSARPGPILDVTFHNTPGGAESLTMAGRQNVLVRIQKRFEEKVVDFEMWNVDGSGYQFIRLPVQSWGDYGGSRVEFIHNVAEWSPSIGFARVDNDLLPLRSKPPTTAAQGDLVEWRFDGNASDSSGRGYGLSISGAQYIPTPDQGVYAVASTVGTPPWAPFLPLRAGHASSLDGLASYSMSDETDQVVCSWGQIDGPSVGIFDNRQSCTPKISGLVFGSYRFKLRVKATNGDEEDSTELEVGAVAYDDDGNVIYPDDRLNTLLGPSKVLGQNGWDWFDAQALAMAQGNWDQYEINGGTWRLEHDQTSIGGVPRSGTIYTDPAQPSKIFGIGTNFLDVFCGGVVGPRVAGYIVGITNQGFPGRSHPRLPASCQSDTEMTMSWWWSLDHIAPPGIPWGTYELCADCGDWFGVISTSNINFYDAALAHYVLYYRTGWVKARDAARWLADRWYRTPWLATGPPRDLALTSLAVRLVDGGNPSDILPALRAYSGKCAVSASSAAIIDDPREDGYCLGYVALHALMETDSALKADTLNLLATAYDNRWGPQQRENGNYINNQFEGDTSRVLIATNGSATMTKHSGTDFDANYCGVQVASPGTINIGVDRVTVTGTDTSFTGHAGHHVYLRGTLDGQPWSQASQIASVSSAISMALVHPWRGDAGSVTDYQIVTGLPSGGSTSALYYTPFFGVVNSSGATPNPVEPDADNWYWCRVVSGTEITLDKPYTGDTSGGKIYRRRTVQNLTGRGSQPFMQGILARSMFFAADALDTTNNVYATKYRESAARVVDWLWEHGRNPDTNGMRYGVEWSNCLATGYESALECWWGPPDGGRSFNIEVFDAISRDYLAAPTVTKRFRGDALFTATYASPGFASPYESDGRVAEAIQTGSWRAPNWNALTKNYGQAFGVGGGHTWAASRDYRSSTILPLRVTHGYSLASVTNAVSARARVTLPTGTVLTVACGQDSVCEFEVDPRLGDSWISIEYLDADGNTIDVSGPVLTPSPRRIEPVTP